jgi:ABC-type spermidine/putrescine transport system permease subunit I
MSLAGLGFEGELPQHALHRAPPWWSALVYNYLPFVILACYAPLSRMNPEITEASRDLGASAWTTFRRVTLPMTVPGIATGFVFVFVLSIGNFVTPALLGGGQFQMIGNLVYAQFLTANDWPFGAALSMVLIAVMLVAVDGPGNDATERASWREARGRPSMTDDPRTFRLMLLILGVVFAFLYIPISVLVGAVLQREWSADRMDRIFGQMVRRTAWKTTISFKAAGNTLIVALFSTILLDTLLGTLAGCRVSRFAVATANALETIIFAPMIIPDIVLAIALLSMFSTAQ